MKFFILSLATILSVNAYATSFADALHSKAFTEYQALMVRSQMNLFTEIASSEITSSNHQQLSTKLNVTIYCGYEAFANEQEKFARIIKQNEDLIFYSSALAKKYDSLLVNEASLPIDLSICSSFNGAQVAMNEKSTLSTTL